MSPLDHRIATAFSSDASSEAIAALISEVQAAASEASRQADDARTRALDPALPGEAVATARREMEDAAFIRDRMGVAAERLSGRLKEVRRTEEDRRRQVMYDDAKKERDMLAQEIAATYPRLVEEMVDLLSRLAVNADRIDHVNERRLPRGAERLLQAEMVARGLTGFAARGVDIPSLVRGTRLAAFKFDRFAPYAWPKAPAVSRALRGSSSEPSSLVAL